MKNTQKERYKYLLWNHIKLLTVILINFFLHILQ